MRKSFIIATILVLTAVWIITSNLELTSEKIENKLLAPPTPAVKYFAFGYTETIGDSLWLNALQNFTYCEQDRGGGNTEPNGRRAGINRTPTCHKSYLYYILDALIELVPRFQLAAQIGPMVLSAIVDDIEGATLLYKKAVHLYPHDWVILSRAATHFSLELEDYQTAARLFLEAANNGAPSWMGLYASKLSLKIGHENMARKIMKDFAKRPNISEREKRWLEEKMNSLNQKNN